MNVSRAASTAGLNAINALANGGSLVLLSGSMPATPLTALSGNTTLATFAFAATAFGAPTFSGGYMVATAAFVAASVNPVASGTAGFGRIYQSDGTTVVADVTVGTSGTDLIIGSTTITTGVPVTASSLVTRMPAV